MVDVDSDVCGSNNINDKLSMKARTENYVRIFYADHMGQIDNEKLKLLSV